MNRKKKVKPASLIDALLHKFANCKIRLIHENIVKIRFFTKTHETRDSTSLESRSGNDFDSNLIFYKNERLRLINLSALRSNGVDNES